MRRCLSSIDHALSHLPMNARLVVVTRTEPALSLPRLRAAGALTELRARQLAFTVEEAHELLVVDGQLPLRGEDLEVLVGRTEGWPAALVLCGLWLRTVDDPADAVRRFGGDQRFVAEYLTSEVLGTLDEDRRSFLHGLAVLGEFTPELCDDVLDRTDSAAELAELGRSFQFVERLERGDWFRMHALFAEFARAELAVLDPDAAARIHRGAVEWLRSRGMPLEAAEHAAAAGDHELVAQVLICNYLALIRQGDALTYLRWVRSLPEECIVEHPLLAASAAMAAVLVGGRTLEQRRLLQIADRACAARVEAVEPHTELFILIARSITVARGVSAAVGDGLRAVRLAQTASDDEAIPGTLAAYGRALFFAGDLGEAAAVSSQALEHPHVERRAPSLVVAHTTVALAAVELGRLSHARKHAEAAKAAVGRIAASRSWLGANASVALGLVLAAEGRLDEAERQLATAEPYFRDDVNTLHGAWLGILLARVRVRRGRLDEAAAALSIAQGSLMELTDGGWVPALAETVEREIDEARARASSGEILEAPSEAELNVLRLLETAMSAREIANALYVSPNTVNTHTRALYRKLGVHSRADAVARAVALGLLTPA